MTTINRRREGQRKREKDKENEKVRQCNLEIKMLKNYEVKRGYSARQKHFKQQQLVEQNPSQGE